MPKRDFLTLLDCSSEELANLVARGRELKESVDNRDYRPLTGATAALILLIS